MRGFGQIAELCAFARPEIGVITMIAPVHLEKVGDLEGVVRAKTELIAALPPGGTAIVPAGFAVARDDVTVIRVGEDVTLESFEPPRLVTSLGETEVSFSARHLAANAVTAIATAHALGLETSPRASTSRSPSGATRSCRSPGGGLLINDAWNANPISVRAALEHLAALANGRRRVAVLGEMAELGAYADEAHREVARAVQEIGVEVLVSVGPAGAGLRRTIRRGRGRRDRAAARRGEAGRRRPRQGCARARARARRRIARGGDRVTRVLVAGLVAGVISIVAGPRFIAFLRRKELGQHIREEGPAGHVVKQGTPTAGGILILLAAAIAFLSLSEYRITGLTVLFVTVACGAIGFLDDYIKFTHKRSLGLSGRWKLLMLVGVAAATGYLAHRAGLPHLTSVYVPVIGFIPLGWAWYAFIFLVIAGASNAVNLSDGLDGLAAGTAIISLFTFTTMAIIAFIRSAPAGTRRCAACRSSISPSSAPR